MFNILEEPIIRVRTRADERRASLPETFALLMRDEVEAFPALRPHQRHAWHAFIVQLGAMALQRAGASEPPTDAPKWQALIRGLTPNFPADEPWQLVVDDITAPAFMQPPARAVERKRDYEDKVLTPDELDMLITSKNHDLKRAVASDSGVDDWLFALISLQTMEGIGGARNYGISRMPSGYGNRPAFSLTPSVRLGIHIKRDIMVLMEWRQEILNEYPMSDTGIALLWTVPWDGTKAEPLLLTEMEPFYIEICRRIRLLWSANKLSAVRAKSEVGGKRLVDVKGLTGDPWVPISNIANAQGTPHKFLDWEYKFGYERIVDCLSSPDWKEPYLLRLAQFDKGFDGAMTLVARGMVRSEGLKLVTKGYHERIIPIRRKLRLAMGQRAGSGDAMDDVGRIANERIKQAAIVQGLLKESIETFIVQGDIPRLRKMNRNKRRQVRESAEKWSDKLDAIIDRAFFEDLQVEFEEEDADERDRIRNKWLLNDKDDDGVINHARRILTDAQDTLPCLTLQRYRARVQSDSVFNGGIRGDKGLPFLFDTKNDKKEDNECQNSDQTQETQRRLL